MKTMRLFQFALLIAFVLLKTVVAPAGSVDSTGFLVIAPDRGYQGNQHIRNTFEDFKKGYHAALVFISLNPDDEDRIRTKLKEGVASLKTAGARDVVILPLVLTDGDPHLKKTKKLLGHTEGLKIAPSSGGHYLLAQILEERAKGISQEPLKERLVVVGFGATNHEEAEEIRSTLNQLIAEAKHRLPFQETQAVVLYHNAGAEKVVREENQKAQELMKSLAADKNLRTVIVPFHLGFKHTGSMQMAHIFERTLKGLPVRYVRDKEILPHANVALWLKRRANEFVSPRPEELGIVVMPHGAGEYINETLTANILPLSPRYNVEIGFGMADHETLQEALEKVAARGARRILILRLYDISLSLKGELEYLIGRAPPPKVYIGGPAFPPPRLKTGAILYTSGGFDNDALIAEVLLDRVLEVSKDPKRETVILLAHGAGGDHEDQFWLEQLKLKASFIQERAPQKFRAVVGATVREDWPAQRTKAVAKVRTIIEEASGDGGRVLVIADRPTGAGPYQRILAGLPYTLNGKGLAPHPNLTRWIEKEIENWMRRTLTEEIPK
ncbi:MAG: hypothetical protein HY695_03825 [Deltaproteobacteria bacterium]|nr:hypothetical protein [Deltaproteobacteria bacterium]